MAALLGFLVGAFFGVLLVSRLLTWLFWKLMGKTMRATILAYVVIVPALLILPALGNADGGPLVWTAGLIYMLPCLFFLVIDIRTVDAAEARRSRLEADR